MIAFHDGALDGIGDKIKKYLRAGGDPNMRSLFVHRLTLLHHAALEGLEDSVELLVMAGANPDINDGNGRSPLHAAVVSQNHVVVNTLLAAKAKANHFTLTRLTPFHLACVDGDMELIESMIKAKADVNLPTEVCWTPLHFAAAHDHYDLVIRLIDAGADFEAETGGGLSLLELLGDSPKRAEIEKQITARRRENAKLSSR